MEQKFVIGGKLPLIRLTT
ncbi:hypothetical protein Godav_004249 [Gossypium davidsonii]|uniref:Uncharacterized protein n=2 Tax=Gossypium TaxID=3633 RepID=A0A7J8SLA0_GOSDV|nr:hypothetical protein [Gossypium davidsonii]MBA0662226.1 hypothetical protein [Gossypium klotzschianum]